MRLSLWTLNDAHALQPIHDSERVRNDLSPDVGRSSPMIMRMVVDLPAPFGPGNPVTVPGAIVKLRECTAVVSP